MTEKEWTAINSDAWAIDGSLGPIADFVENVGKIPVLYSDEWLDEIELIRRRAIKNCGNPLEPGHKARIAMINILADYSRLKRDIKIENNTLYVGPNVSMGDQHRRTQLEAQRREQLRTPSVQKFIRRMETSQWIDNKQVSIFSLMRDGEELADSLAKVAAGDEQFENVIKPYLQNIDGDEVCKYTNLELKEVWRYFRHTWLNTYQSVPGRSMMMLVRDASRPYHPVMGIASISSSALKMSTRDKHIKWDRDQVLEECQDKPSKRMIKWLSNTLTSRVDEIYKNDLLEDGALTVSGLKEPTRDLVSKLREEGRRYKTQHIANSEVAEYKKQFGAQYRDKGYWEDQATTALFRSKRCAELAKLLEIKIDLNIGPSRPLTKKSLKKALELKRGQEAVSYLAKTAKSISIGTKIADLSICGAIPPYNQLLVGKLTAMLAVSPQVIRAYNQRYSKQPSIIASSMAGKPIYRSSRLAYIITTSIFEGRPTQYDHISIPGERIGGKKGYPIKYKSISEKTFGFGTYQFSDITIKAMSEFLKSDANGQRVHYVFGEGASPKLRSVRDGLTKLGFIPEKELQHGHQKPVFAVNLLFNSKEFLLRQVKHQKYRYNIKSAKKNTQAIIDWWFERWLNDRIIRPGILDKVRKDNLTRPIMHGARVILPPTDLEQISLF